LLEVHTYSGSPFPPLKQLPVAKEHFDRWMELFTQTTDSLFGALADEVTCEEHGKMFNYKIE
jgi:hemoglobin